MKTCLVRYFDISLICYRMGICLMTLSMNANSNQLNQFEYQFSDFMVGTAEYTAGPTGVTVFSFPKGALAAIDIRGGAAAVRESSSIDDTNTWSTVDAIVLAGGSTYGLEAASGVSQAILEKRKSSNFDAIPAVPAAIVYDFAGRNNLLYPDAALGKKAYLSAQTNKVAVGKAGAGINTTVGKFFGREFAERAGQGAAFYESEGIKIFALTVVNSLGNVLNADGSVLAGNLNSKTGLREPIVETLLKQKSPFKDAVVSGNTTISIIITNAKLDRSALKRLAIMTHTGMAQSIDPFHTESDGDVLFAVSTYRKDNSTQSESVDVSRLGIVATHLMREAVRRSVQ